MIHGQENKLDNLKISNEFKVNKIDKCIHYKYENNICTIICLYVDDLLIFDSKIHAVNYVKSLFNNNIDKKHLPEVEVIFGIKVTRSQNRIFFGSISPCWEDLKEI